MSLLEDNLQIAIASHDAGGAEILSSLVRRENWSCSFSLSGPAVSIFQGKIGSISNGQVSEVLLGADLLISGTSSPSAFELHAIKLARSRRIRSIAVLDHWINYRERFVIEGRLILPDEIWVVDSEAHALANRTFPGISLRVIDNPYKLDILERIASLSNGGVGIARKMHRTALYVTEPSSVHAERRFGDKRFWGYTEQDALTYFLKHLHLIDSTIRKVVVRPHPSEDSSKYYFAQADKNVDVLVRKNFELIEEISAADIVVGCNTMAMVVGTWARKRVLCSIPPGGRGFSLSAQGIEFIRDIVEPVKPFQQGGES